MFKKLLPFLIIAAAVIPSVSFAYTWTADGNAHVIYSDSPDQTLDCWYYLNGGTPDGHYPCTITGGVMPFSAMVKGNAPTGYFNDPSYVGRTYMIQPGGGVDSTNVFTIGAYVCDPASVSNGSVAAYPDCSITCDNGYNLQGQTCVANAIPAAALKIEMPSNASSYFTGQVSSILADVGLLGVIGFAAAIPLLFWLIRAIIGLFVEIAGERKAAREYAEWEKEHNA